MSPDTPPLPSQPEPEATPGLGHTLPVSPVPPQVIYPQSYGEPVPQHYDPPAVPVNPQPIVYIDPLAAAHAGPGQSGLALLLQHLTKRVVLLACVIFLVASTVGAAAYVSFQKTRHDAKVATKPSVSTNRSSVAQSTKPAQTPPASTSTAPTTTSQTPPKSNTPSVPSGRQPSSSSSTYAISEMPPYVLGNVTLYYAGASQYPNGGTGASANLTQAAPTVPYLGTVYSDHSVMEIAVSSAGTYNYVEVGWMVDKNMYGDDNPHLFVGRWIGASDTCEPQPTGCGFVQVSATNVPKEGLSPSGTGNFKINFANGNWNVYYNGDEIGYFPESLWGPGHDSVTRVQVYGEALQQTGTSQCIQMGNGIAGNAAGAAQVSGYTLIGSSSPAAFSSYYQTSANHYYLGSPSATGFSLGGPGVC